MDCWLFSSIFWWNRFSIRYYKHPDQIHEWNIYIMNFSTQEIHLKNVKLWHALPIGCFIFCLYFHPETWERSTHVWLISFILGGETTPRILIYWVGTLPSNSGRLYGDAPRYINPINNDFCLFFRCLMTFQVFWDLKQKKQLFVRRWPGAMQIQQHFSGEPLSFCLSFCLDFGSERSWLLTIIFTPIWGNDPFWLVFFKGVETTN